MFIRLPDNILLNTDHISSISFTPERSGFDEEEQRPYYRRATLVIGITETQLETFDRFDGECLGVAAVTRKLHYYAEDAVNFWNYFNLIAVNTAEAKGEKSEDDL